MEGTFGNSGEVDSPSALYEGRRVNRRPVGPRPGWNFATRFDAEFLRGCGPFEPDGERSSDEVSSGPDVPAPPAKIYVKEVSLFSLDFCRSYVVVSSHGSVMHPKPRGRVALHGR